MKLKLNRTLRAALIAAITTVGFTISQAQAETNTTRIDTTDTSLISWFALTEDSNVTAGSKTTGWNNLLTFVAGEEGADGYGQTGADHSMNGGIEANGKAFTLSFDINSMTAGTLLHMNTSGGSGNWRHVDLTTTTEALTLTFKGNGQSSTATPVDDWSTITITGNGSVLTMYLNGVSQGTIDMSGATNWNNEKLTSIRFGSENGSNVETADLRNILIYNKALSASEVRALTSSEEYGTYTWVGDGSANEWSSSASCWTKEGSQDIVPFSNDNDALFNATGSTNATVSITGDVAAGTVTVDSTAYTFNIGTEGSLTANKLTITGTGAKLTVNGDGRTMKIDSLTNEGELAIGAGATVSLAAGVTLDGSHSLNVTGDGTFAIQKLTVSAGTHNLGVGMNMTEIALNGGTLAFTNGTSTVSGKLISESDNSELVVGTDSSAAVLKVNRLENGNINNTSKHSDITINSKGTLKITGNDTRTDYKQGSLILGEWNVTPTTVTVKGLLIADQVAATAGDSGYVMNINGGTALLKGLQRKNNDRKQEINITNDGKLILGSTGIVGTNTGSNVSLTVNGGTIGIYADNVTIDKNITVSGATTFDTQKYTVNDITVAQGATGGTLTVSGNLTGDGTITKDGAGELVLSGAGNNISNTINLQAGTLNLTGAFVLDNMQIQGEQIEYIGGTGIAQGSGFKKASGTLNLVTVGTDATLTVDDGAIFTRGGSVVTVNAATGVGTLSGTPDYTSLWINSATTVSYTAAQTIADEHSATVGTVHLNADGATVTMDKADAAVALVLTEGISGTVNATAATTISSLTGPVAEKTLTVDGNSVVAIQSADAFAGNVNVIGGTVKLGNQTALGAHNSAADSTKTITVGTGATIDVNSQGDAKYVYTLDGGTLTNMGNAIGHNMAQTSGLVLTDDSYIGSEGSKEMWVLAGSYAVNTVNLNNNKLTKKGNSTFGFSNSNISAGTLQVDAGTLLFNDDNGKKGSIAANIVLNGGTVAGTLNQSGNISVTAKEETSTGATINVGNNTLTLSTDEDKTLTLTGGISVGDTGSVKVEGAGTLLVNSTLNLGGKLTAAGNIAVGESGNLTLTAGSTVYQTIDNDGTVSLTGVTLGAGFEEQTGGTGYYDLSGNVTTSDANHYEGTGSTYVQVVNGGSASGSDIQWKGKGYNLEENGTIIVGGGSPTYDTFFVVDQIDASAIAAGAHYGETQTIDVGDWASLNMDEALDGKKIVTHDYSFVQGTALTPEAVSLAAGGVTFFTQNVTTADGIVFTASGMGVAMANSSEEGDPVQYSTAAESIAVQAAVMTNTSSEDVTVANNIDAASIVNNGAGKLILTNVYQGDQASLANIAATTGDITLQNVGANPVELQNLTIGAGKTVAVYLGDEIAPNNEGTVTITDTLTGGSATLLANLTLKGGSTLDVNGGADKALTLGSTLTIDLGNGGFVNLDQATIDALNSLQNGERLNLIVGTPTATLDYAGDAVGAEWYNDLFYRPEDLVGDYKVYTEGGAFGLVKQSSVPEPTTGTLSLLALAALAARRRRK